jgi:hypothetical protein
MFIKEEVEDPELHHRIRAILIPYEFTRLDGIADLLFSAAKEIKQDDEQVDADVDDLPEKSKEPKFIPVAFHEDCIKLIQKSLSVSLIKRTRSGYSSPDNKVAVICAVSKEHDPNKKPNYWFAFHPHQKEFLDRFLSSYVTFGCGSANQILRIPYEQFESWLKDSWTTTEVPAEFRLPTGRSYAAKECLAACSVIQFWRNRTGEL